jgi:glc operon protein GlcG
MGIANLWEFLAIAPEVDLDSTVVAIYTQGGHLMASLTLAEAERILAAAKAKVLEMGVKMSVSVVDPRGDLIAMFRTDGASWRTPPISRAKAVAAACFGRASGELTDNAMSPVFRGLMAMEGGHMIPGQGALPVYRNGELLGAVGGSGGTAQQDEDAARAGIDAIGLSVTP